MFSSGVHVKIEPACAWYQCMPIGRMSRISLSRVLSGHGAPLIAKGMISSRVFSGNGPASDDRLGLSLSRLTPPVACIHDKLKVGRDRHLRERALRSSKHGSINLRVHVVIVTPGYVQTTVALSERCPRAGSHTNDIVPSAAQGSNDRRHQNSQPHVHLQTSVSLRKSVTRTCSLTRVTRTRKRKRKKGPQT